MLLGHVSGSTSFVFLDIVEGDFAAFLLRGEGDQGTFLRRPAHGGAEEDWRALLSHLSGAEGIVPALICCNGDPAAIRAIRAVQPDALMQISLSHRLRALGRQLTSQGRGLCLTECRRIFAAPDRSSAIMRYRAWRDRWLSRGEGGVRTLEGDLAWCLTFYRFPPGLRRTVRSLRLLRIASRAARAAQTPPLLPLPSSESEPTLQAAPAERGDGVIVHVDNVITDPTLAQTLRQYRRDGLRVAETAPAIASAIGVAARLLGRGH